MPHMPPHTAHDIHDIADSELERTVRELQRQVRTLQRTGGDLLREKEFIAAVLSTTAALVVVLDLDGRIVLFNAACEKLTGYRFEEARNKPFWDLFVPDDEIGSVKAVFQDLRSGSFPNEHVNHWLTRDGARRLIHWTNTSLVDPSRTVAYVIGTGVDITERKRAEEALLRKQRRIMADLDLAAKIQRSLIPTSSPNLRSMRVAWRFEPCDQIVGDMFNYVYTGGDHIGFYMLDVCGHGLSSALIAAAASQSVRTHCELAADEFEKLSPRAVLRSLDRMFPFERFENFFSLVYVTVHHRTGLLRYGCAGHPSPLLLRRDGTLEVLGVHGPVIGVGGDGFQNHEEIRFRNGDRLVLYSDGILEYPNPEGVFFGKHRFAAALQRHGQKPIQSLIDSLHGDLMRFSRSAPAEDDLSLMIVERV